MWSPKVDSTCSLAGQSCASHFTSQSLGGSVPISTNNTSGNSPVAPSILGPGGSAMNERKLCLHKACFLWMMSSPFFHPWNRGCRSLTYLVVLIWRISEVPNTQPLVPLPRIGSTRPVLGPFVDLFLETWASACSWPSELFWEGSALLSCAVGHGIWWST